MPPAELSQSSENAVPRHTATAPGAWPSSEHAWAPGRPQRVGNYRLLECIGEGATGEVYRAEHVELGRSVALKLLRPELSNNRHAVQRMFAEARAANRVRSDHIVEVTDLQRDAEGHTFLVMELLSGRDLGRAWQDETDLLARLQTLRQLTETLALVHEAGVVHRDLKPENVFLTERDGRPFVKLIDFGVAKLAGPDGRGMTETLPGLVVGTPQYMAPEQACAAEVDHRCDLYALGVMIFEALTGQVPFSRPTLHALLQDIISAPPRRPSECAELPARIRAAADALLDGCLQKRPEARPQSARLILAQLDGLLATLAAGETHEAAPALRRPEHLVRTLRLPRGNAAPLSHLTTLRVHTGWRGRVARWLARVPGGRLAESPEPSFAIVA